MAPLQEIVRFLDAELRLTEFEDSCLNGLQVESGENVTRIAVSVDAGESVIEKSIAAQAGLLLVHHGLLWAGANDRITGPHGRKVKRMLAAGLSLYAAHLPLDGHEALGNNFILAEKLKLSALERAVKYRTAMIGCLGRNEARLELAAYKEILDNLRGSSRNTLILPFGPSIPERVCVVSGSAADIALQYQAVGFDTFVTGEPKQMLFHFAKEHRLNILCAGHYATETVGVEAVGALLEKKFGVQSVFIDEPTGI
jgi:dinuclear metal center YbgI/SA1388 family protein